MRRGSSARSAANASITSSSSGKPICAKFLRLTPAITTNFERICPWTRVRRPIGRSTDMARSQRGRFSADFIINTAGYSFQQGHGIGLLGQGRIRPGLSRRLLRMGRQREPGKHGQGQQQAGGCLHERGPPMNVPFSRA
jgi:hypothetical protein